MSLPTKPLNKAGVPIGAIKPQVSNQLLEDAHKESDAVLKELEFAVDWLERGRSRIPPQTLWVE